MSKKKNSTALVMVPNEIVKDAEAVMAASEMKGETSEVPNVPEVELQNIPDVDSKELYDAAKMTRKDDPAATVIDAEYSESLAVPTDAEFAAAELLNAELRKANDDNADDTRIVPHEVTPLELLGIIIKSKFNDMKLKAIAKGNDFLDWLAPKTDALLKWAIAKKEQLDVALVEWKKAREEAASLRAAMREETVPLDKALFISAMETISELINDKLEKAEEVYDRELRRLSKRITGLENQLRKATKKSSTIDTDQLNALLKAVTNKRMTQAANLYRAVTGTDLATAKAALEGLAKA